MSLKTRLSGVTSSFEAIIFCVLLSGHLDCKESLSVTDGECCMGCGMPCRHERR